MVRYNLGRYAKYLILLTGFGLFSCEESLDINTDKNTYSDDIADITFLNNSFYTTNYDLSGNARSQIDLLEFEENTDNIFITDSYDLDMNGQGYFAMTNDGTDIYLQSRSFGNVVKCSPIGERAFLRLDDVDDHWQASGIAYNSTSDSLYAMYRNLRDLKQYRLRSISKDITGDASSDKVFHLGFIDDTYHGVYALEYHNSKIYMLGVDTTQTDLIIELDTDLNVISKYSVLDSTVVGLCFRGDDLFLSFRDRHIEKFESF